MTITMWLTMMMMKYGINASAEQVPCRPFLVSQLVNHKTSPSNENIVYNIYIWLVMMIIYSGNSTKIQ